MRLGLDIRLRAAQSALLPHLTEHSIGDEAIQPLFGGRRHRASQQVILSGHALSLLGPTQRRPWARTLSTAASSRRRARTNRWRRAASVTPSTLAAVCSDSPSTLVA